jgi:hypothetical protein
LGGKVVVEDMQAAKLKVNLADYKEVSATVAYEISKPIFMNKFCDRNCMQEKDLSMIYGRCIKRNVCVNLAYFFI